MEANFTGQPQSSIDDNALRLGLNYHKEMFALLVTGKKWHKGTPSQRRCGWRSLRVTEQRDKNNEPTERCPKAASRCRNHTANFRSLSRAQRSRKNFPPRTPLKSVEDGVAVLTAAT